VKGIIIHNQLIFEKTVNNTTCYSTCLQICSIGFNSYYERVFANWAIIKLYRGDKLHSMRW